MRLLLLKLTNFRPFESVELDLNADGLIGVRGLNGAGKSSLLAAIEWALYGQRRGAGSIPPRRAGAPAGERCQVELHFAFDGHHYDVMRNEKKAHLRIDGDVVAQTLTETTNAVVAHLGISRNSFTSTFYARQREIEALKPQADDDKRRRQLEDLLGLTRLRTACTLARQEAREQELIVRTLESEAIDHDGAKQLLAELEAHVKEHTPAVEAKRLAREQAQASKDAAWQALTDARERAEQAFNAESAATIAEAEAKQAAERAEETTGSLQAAREAAAELKQLEPVLACAPELRARDGELEAHREAHARATKLRERKHAAEKRGATLTDQLEALAPLGTPAALAQQITAAEEALEQTTERLLKLGTDVPTAAAKARTARARANAHSEVEQLAPAIAELNELRGQQARLVSELAATGAEEHELRRTLAEEASHREEIERDGEAARCLRCKRPYGADFSKIILEYDALIATLHTQIEAVTTRASASQERQQALAARVSELVAAETRKAALESQFASELAENPDQLEEQAQRLGDEQAQLQGQHGQQDAHLKELRRQRDEVAASAEQRQQIEQAIREAAAEAELFARELAELAMNGYDAEAHAALREQLATVLAADERARPLRPRAAELPLLERRLAEEQQQTQATAERAKATRERAHSCAPDREALATAQSAFEAADKALAEAAETLKQVEEQALRESAEVQAARDSLDQARKQGLRLKKERLELRYRVAAAEVLKDYGADAQRRAFPTVARETSELLAVLTRGRYSEARLDDTGALELHDDGAFRPLRRFSGGEQDLANLCLRIALSRAVSRQRGTEAGFIILDEVFGSQDLERREQLIEQLKELRNDFRQVFVVSHFDDVVEECDLQIDVARKAGISTAVPR